MRRGMMQGHALLEMYKWHDVDNSKIHKSPAVYGTRSVHVSTTVL